MAPLEVAVIGSGIAGLSAAWLIARRHKVTVLERNEYAGGHSNTVDAGWPRGSIPVDTGFIVYNPPAYPNLTALFEHLKVPVKPAPMTFSVSLENGRYEYSGTGAGGLFGQPSNIVNPNHWRVLADVMRFFRTAQGKLEAAPDDMTLGAFLKAEGYSRAFADLHLVPMTAAIWSCPEAQALDYPAKAFVKFFANHGLLKVKNRPQWMTVDGGSREYVRRLVADGGFAVETGNAVTRIRRDGRVTVTLANGAYRRFDHVVIATHADEALALLADPDTQERALLSSFRYTENLAVLHGDRTFMPRRERVWSSWNALSEGGAGSRLYVTYWMNRLQTIPGPADFFVTLNPPRAPKATLASFDYTHPVMDVSALTAQKRLWTLQGRRNTWFCGAHFGAGFHEDGLQAGLAVAEDLAGVRRPWSVKDESGRIHRLARATPVATLPARLARTMR
ncbi:MAG: FAD-dependent oxidoreductase [Hyphomicrobiales bacterium]